MDSRLIIEPLISEDDAKVYNLKICANLKTIISDYFVLVITCGLQPRFQSLTQLPPSALETLLHRVPHDGAHPRAFLVDLLVPARSTASFDFCFHIALLFRFQQCKVRHKKTPAGINTCRRRLFGIFM